MLNNKGWGMKDFITLLCCLAFCLIIIIFLTNRLKNMGNKETKLETEFSGSDNSIGTYIDIEDEMVDAAKKYEISQDEDIVIIKLNKLIENGYINIVKDPKNNKNCSGYIMYDGNKREYKAYLSCSGNYQTSDYNANFE